MKENKKYNDFGIYSSSTNQQPKKRDNQGFLSLSLSLTRIINTQLEEECHRLPLRFAPRTWQPVVMITREKEIS